MSKLKSMARKLDRYRVMLAQETERQRIEVAKKVIKERVEKDLEFAQDVLKAVGNNLPAEIKKAAEETVARETKKEVSTIFVDESGLDQKTMPEKCAEIDKEMGFTHEGDLAHTMVPVQTDGGGTVLVNETDLSDYPKDK
jgi:rubrerythrin